MKELLATPLASEQESRKLNFDLTSLLNKPTTKEKLQMDQFKSPISI